MLLNTLGKLDGHGHGGEVLEPQVGTGIAMLGAGIRIKADQPFAAEQGLGESREEVAAVARQGLIAVEPHPIQHGEHEGIGRETHQGTGLRTWRRQSSSSRKLVLP
jgi:hypothetical protein